MSRIRFEWNIESQKVDRSDGEDRQLKLRRRRNIFRLLLLIFLLLAAIGLAALAVRQRLIDVRNQYAQLLQDTVKAEVAALRIGDMNSWLKLQSDESDEWLGNQRALFRHYEALKTEGTIELTGSIVAVHIDDTRARVLVREDVNGNPYVRLWFYQRAEDGWLHVAPDYSFWGESQNYQAGGISVNFREADQQFARQLADVLEDWLRRSCNLLNCRGLSTMQVEVVPNAPGAVAWIDPDAMHLRLRSPYFNIARADLPFDGAYRLQVSKLLAERLVEEHSGYHSAIYPHDAYFLRETAINWLGGWLLELGRSEGLVQSLAIKYGSPQVAQLLTELGPKDDMSRLQQIIPDALELADLDWRDFIAWRLSIEAELIAARAENEWLRLYDTSEESARIAAYERFNRNAPTAYHSVIDQLIWTNEAAMPQLRASVQVGAGSDAEVEIVLFNLVNQVWKRAS